jgi:hypothetical protein
MKRSMLRNNADGPMSIYVADGSPSVALHSGLKNGSICQKQGRHLLIQSENIVDHGLKLLGLVEVNVTLFHCRKSINRAGVCQPHKLNDAH